MARKVLESSIAVLLLAGLFSGCATSPPSEKVGGVNVPVKLQRSDQSPPPAAITPSPQTTTGQGSASGHPASLQVEAQTQNNSAASMANPEASVFFAPGSSAISLYDQHKLKQMAIRLRADHRQTVILFGYSNDHGSRSFNLAVADARIHAVANHLKKFGVATSQIRRDIRGAAIRLSDCRSSECRRLMRRVDLIFPKQPDEKYLPIP